MDEQKNNLLYIPELKPERDYLSDAEFTHKDQPLAPLPPDVDDTPAQIVEQFEELEGIMNDLPEDLQFLKKTVEKLKKRVNVVWPRGYQPKEPPIEYKPVTPKKLPDGVNHVGHIDKNDNPKLADLPELFPKKTMVNLQIGIPKTLVQLIQDKYRRDTLRLDKYYLQQLQLVLQRYFQQMLMAMAETGMEDITDLTKKFEGTQVKVPSGQGLEHLKDHIVRSQMIRDHKTRLFRKTHSVDNTLKHMRSWHVAEKQRERYYKEKYKDSSTYTQSHSNALLREARSSYDKAYSASLYSMYKYLNSSILLVNDILDMTIKEGQAKAMLVQNGVDIYAFDQGEIDAAQGGQINPSSSSSNNTTSNSNEQNATPGNNATGASSGEALPKDGINTPNAEDYSTTPMIGGGFGGALKNTAKGIFGSITDTVKQEANRAKENALNQARDVLKKKTEKIPGIIWD